MKAGSSSLDTSVLLAALVANEPYHKECHGILKGGGSVVYAHAFAEFFNTMTGGRKPFRIPASVASALLSEVIMKFASPVSLTPFEVLKAMTAAEERGVRGGAVFDYLHLVAARKARVERIVTLNVRHFRAFWRHGDPAVVHPASVV